jgi:ribonuclease BN (tRNA processing enzyme)
VTGSDGEVLILDAGSGLLHLTPRISPATTRIDILLTHLHMDHIQGLGFFPPLRSPEVETHLWGPISTTMSLAERLGRYLSPPLFPVRLRDLSANQLHDIGPGTMEVGSLRVSSDLVCHPGPTLGYRVEEGGKTLVYLPDHEPALGHREFPGDARWTSGAELIRNADLLIHDSQYTEDEYSQRVGWGHSSLRHAVLFAEQMSVRTLMTFHHDPEHTDDMLDALHGEVRARTESGLEVVPGTAGSSYEL